MNDKLLQAQKNIEKLNETSQHERISLFPGIRLSYLAFETSSFSMRHKHDAMAHIIQINYCKSGQMEWKMGNGNSIYLNPGDFSLHTMTACKDSLICFPTGQYAGLTIYIDLQEAAANPPALLRDTNIFTKRLQEKFCPGNAVSFLAGNEQTENIFSAFYGQPVDLQRPYQALKTLELLLYLAKLEFTPENQLTAYQTEQVEIIRKIHDRLTGQMNERITIEELSKQYLINPTTLKSAFKAVYGASIAAHIKQHRMEQGAKMLRESEMSIAEIAQAVGYDSQSKFSAAFKGFFGIQPREYRRRHR